VPTYDYQCRSCGTITEVVHSMLEDGPTTCEKCGGPLRRVVHPTGIIFRGSGFYKTDSRSSKSGASPEAPTAAADNAKSAKTGSDASVSGKGTTTPSSTTGTTGKAGGSGD